MALFYRQDGIRNVKLWLKSPSNFGTKYCNKLKKHGRIVRIGIYHFSHGKYDGRVTENDIQIKKFIHMSYTTI